MKIHDWILTWDHRGKTWSRIWHLVTRVWMKDDRTLYRNTQTTWCRQRQIERDGWSISASAYSGKTWNPPSAKKYKESDLKYINNLECHFDNQNMINNEYGTIWKFYKFMWYVSYLFIKFQAVQFSMTYHKRYIGPKVFVGICISYLNSELSSYSRIIIQLLRNNSIIPPWLVCDL